MSFFEVAAITSSGMYAQRERMNIISENIANVDTLNTIEGGPYRRKIPVLGQGRLNGSFGAMLSGTMSKAGVRVDNVVHDPNPFKKIYEPSNPNADAQGYVSVPDINVVQEMVDMVAATRAYEANIQAFNNARSMVRKALSIGK